MGSGQRRDSFDIKARQMTPINQYYGSLGNLGSPAGPMGLVQPGQSMTPPLSGSYLCDITHREQTKHNRLWFSTKTTFNVYVFRVRTGP